MRLSNGVRLNKEKRKEIADKIVRMIDAGWTSVSGLKERWDMNEKLYRLEPYERMAAASEDSSTFAFPLLKEKVDTLAANIATLITQGDPYFVYKKHGVGSVNSDTVEKTVQFMLKQADFERYMKLHLILTALTGRASYRATMSIRAKGVHAYQESTSSYFNGDLDSANIAYCGLNLEVIHPGDLIVYPVESPDIVRTTLFGHRFYITQGDIWEKQATKEYLTDETEFTSSDTREDEAGRSQEFDRLDTDTSVYSEDEPIRCYSVIVKMDLNDDKIAEYYEVDVAYNERVILSIKPYEYDRPWYYAPTLTHEYDTWYYTNSVAQSLQGLNLMKNELMGLYYDGTLNRAFPTAFMNDEGGFIKDEYLDAKPGRVYPVTGTPQISAVPSQFDPSTFPLLFQYIDAEAEMTIRMSRTSAAQPYRRGTTATEVSAIQQASAVSGNDYLMAYTGSELCAMADFVRQLAYDNFDILKSVYGDAFPAMDQEELVGGGVWEVSARSPSRTPMGRSQAAQGLLQIWMQTQTPHIDVNELIKSIVMDSGLPNADKIYVGMDELQANGGGIGMGAMAGNPEDPGMAGLEGLLAQLGGQAQEGFGGVEPAEGSGEYSEGAGGFTQLGGPVG